MPLERMPPVSLTVLGSGDAFASGGRLQSGYVLGAGGWRALLDAGPTTLAALARTGTAPDALDAVFISHLHGDHYAGLPFLLLDALVAHPRRGPLDVYGPPELDIDLACSRAPLPPRSPSACASGCLRFAPLNPGDVIEVAAPGSKLQARGCRVTVFEVPHATALTCLALRFELEDRVVAYSGDTAWTPALPHLAAGADVFVCEATLRDDPTPTHLSYRELLAHRHEFDARRILLTHLGPEMLDATVESPFELAQDGGRIEI